MTETDAEKLKLMVVDDEPDNLDLLYRTFRRDFRVFKADNAKKALDVLEKQGEMAVIISDQRMPEMNGTEFLSLTVDRFPDTIRILLTGFTDVEDLVDAINSGQVFKYITKPWKPDKLRVIVEQATETYRVVKKRTSELSRALRRESLFNAVTTAIRESLDYESMLQKIVATIGQTFAATCCVLRPVEDDYLTLNQFSYCSTEFSETYSETNTYPDSNSLIDEVFKSGEYQLSQSSQGSKVWQHLALPLRYQQSLLAVLVLYQQSDSCPWELEDISLIKGVSEQAALAISQAKLYHRLQEKQHQISVELEVARQIQHNLLRQSLPELKDVRVQACCYPAREVGGDFFEVLVHPKGDIWLAVGDVSGKGVPAALFMASAISVLRRELSQEIPPMPNIVMQNLNNALSEDLISNNYFITAVLARYTPSSKELVYANAGHVYPLLWSGDAASVKVPKYLKIRGIPLGILPKWQAESDCLTLATGDTLILTSDGVTEASVASKTVDPSQEVVGTQTSTKLMLNQEGLWQLLKQEKQPLSLDSLLARIQAENRVQEDDQTILSLEVL
ncbi:SpoIIE family protein phosphatase [Mastigocoleus testarum]|uniref:Fused response regulator/phosphatase n=1 Tax=Mastigocoleus testarum BC008 TaxID=371196 RepID=A0A0V7ZG01_9CYAN|nr:SpoIIE family protein phosphatase [Mastigocoleus testarum]KST63362.1 fused response regulator/phosphatase [Mastigocoleus testarum BC008]